jgi:hypothetical protein
VQGNHQVQAPGVLDHKTMTYHKQSVIDLKQSVKPDFVSLNPDALHPTSTSKSPARVLLEVQQNDSDWTQDQNLLNFSLVEIGVDGGLWLWTCYDEEPNSCVYHYQSDYISRKYSGYDEWLEVEKKYRYSGAVFAAVDIPNFQYELRLNMDGSGAACNHSPQNSTVCVSGHDKWGTPLFQSYAARVVKYNGKTRIVLYALPYPSLYNAGWVNHDYDFLEPKIDLEQLYQRASEIPVCKADLTVTVWVCKDESGPLNVSKINITAALQGVDKFGLTNNRIDEGKFVGTLEPGPMV